MSITHLYEELKNSQQRGYLRRNLTGIPESKIFEIIKEKFGDRINDEATVIDKIEIAQMLSDFIKIVKPKKILEIGTYQGLSAVFLCQFAEVITVDIHYQPISQEVWDYLGVSKKIKRYVSPKLGQIKRFIESLDFDCAFIDGEHTYKAVSHDYELVKKCMNVIFHDYAWHLVREGKDSFPGVTRFVNSLPEDEVLKSPPLALWRDKNAE